MEFLNTLDWAAILKIVGIDIMLGVDNAIVIALACAALPPELRKKAVLWGTVGAVGLRAILLVFAGFLIALPYIKLIAGAYLLYLGVKLLLENSEQHAHDIPAADKVLTAVKTVLVADFMMSLDNVLAVAGAAESAGAHSTGYAIAGIVLSIPIIVFGAQALMGVMQKFPIIVWLGAGLLGWVGAEMVINDQAMSSVGLVLNSNFGEHAHTLAKAAGFALVICTTLAARIVLKKKVDEATPT